MIVGAGATLATSFSALKHLPGAGGYVFLAAMLIAIRVITWQGLRSRKLWGWRFNFFALYAIPALKALIVVNYSDRDYSDYLYSSSAFVVVIFWFIWAIPNTVYFRKRKHLFDDGAEMLKTTGTHVTASGESNANARSQRTSIRKESKGDRATQVIPSPSKQVDDSVADRAELIVKTMADQKIERLIGFSEIWEGDIYDMNDEKFYEQAQDEIDSGTTQRGLMLKAEVAAEGDEKKARVIYLQARANQLHQERLAKVKAEQQKADDLEKGIRGAKKVLKRAFYLSDLVNHQKKVDELKKEFPDNSHVAEIDYLFNFNTLEMRYNLQHSDNAIVTMDMDDLRGLLAELDKLVAQYPDCPDSELLERRRKIAISKLDDNIFREITHVSAKKFIKRRQYDEAIKVYNEYLTQHSLHADFVADMLENKIPKLIEKKPPKKTSQ